MINKAISLLKRRSLPQIVRRVSQLFARYGLGTSKMENKLQDYIALAEGYNAKLTFPITAVTLKENQDIIMDLSAKHVEWAIHGYVHVDYKNLVPDILNLHLRKSLKIFKEAKIKPIGFRAPYLSFNRNNLKLLYENGIIYDSSMCHWFELDPNCTSSTVKQIISYYKPISGYGVFKVGDIHEIPIALPDDEILIDRVRVRGNKLARYLLQLVKMGLSTADVVVLQLHPERFHIFRDSLENLMKWANAQDVKMISLQDAAQRKEMEKAICITGDIDIMKLSDLKLMKS